MQLYLKKVSFVKERSLERIFYDRVDMPSTGFEL